jgi:hypothetical protein
LRVKSRIRDVCITGVAIGLGLMAAPLEALAAPDVAADLVLNVLANDAQDPDGMIASLAKLYDRVEIVYNVDRASDPELTANAHVGFSVRLDLFHAGKFSGSVDCSGINAQDLRFMWDRLVLRDPTGSALEQPDSPFSDLGPESDLRVMCSFNYFGVDDDLRAFHAQANAWGAAQIGPPRALAGDQPDHGRFFVNKALRATGAPWHLTTMPTFQGPRIGTSFTIVADLPALLS